MLVNKAYNRMRAVEYARTWALDRNPLFVDFTGIGGNCTNFVSQCILAGSCVMNYTPDFGWYYRSSLDRAPAWSGVEYFWEFMTAAPDFVEAGGDTGPFGESVSREALMIGDVIQLANEEGDYYHTLLVTGFGEDGTPLVAAHSIDAFDRPLSSYRYTSARYLHMLGVRVRADIPDCFEGLIEARSLPSER